MKLGDTLRIVGLTAALMLNACQSDKQQQSEAADLQSAETRKAVQNIIDFCEKSRGKQIDFKGQQELDKAEKLLGQKKKDAEKLRQSAETQEQLDRLHTMELAIYQEFTKIEDSYRFVARECTILTHRKEEGVAKLVLARNRMQQEVNSAYQEYHTNFSQARTSFIASGKKDPQGHERRCQALLYTREQRVKEAEEQYANAFSNILWNGNPPKQIPASELKNLPPPPGGW